MNLEKIAIKIGIDDKLLHYFYAATMSKPNFDRKNKILTLSINVTKPLPYQLYIDFKDKLSKTFDNYKVNLHIKSRQADISVADIQGYFNNFMHFVNGVDSNKYLINLNDNEVCILVNDPKAQEKLQSSLDDLREFFKQRGINNSVSLIKKKRVSHGLYKLKL